ncbi:LysM peptidoglycan-binding domain-containing protein [Thermodesulfobacteriota bacterium]
MSLVQTAELEEEILEIDSRKVLTESYTIQEGDYIWKLLRERELLNKKILPDLLTILKRLNPTLGNLDFIQPGEKIIIPLAITPLKQKPKDIDKEVAETIITSPKELQDLDLVDYTVKPGDSLIRVVMGRYNIPAKDLYNEYLELVKQLNPSIRDINTIHAGQKIRLPVYTPQVVRMPVEAPPPAPVKKAAPVTKKSRAPINRQLKEIFTQLEAEWVQTGQHYIPLKSGGHANLKAESFPIINLWNGYRIIVDLYNDLPLKMKKLIESSWANYRIVHLDPKDDLKSALNKIFPLCGYQKIYQLGEPLELGGDIALRITADWILRLSGSDASQGTKTLMITLTEAPIPETPQVIKDFLARLGIKAIDYSSQNHPVEETPAGLEMFDPGNSLHALLEVLLNTTGQRFSAGVEIPVYQSRKKDFNLIIKADFLMNIGGRDAIIDLTGLGPDILSMLQEHQFLVLSLAGENDPAAAVSKTLSFLGVRFDSQRHSFSATRRGESRNILVTIPGIIFRDQKGSSVFATHTKLPEELARFLAQKGYKILKLHPS